MKLSEIIGLDIYDDNGKYKGKAYDLIVNLEEGRVETITLEPLKGKSRNDLKKILAEKSIPYRQVKAVKDIIIVSSTPVIEEKKEEKMKEKTTSAISLLRRRYTSLSPKNI